MSRYNAENAQQELDYAEAILLPKVEEYLEKSNTLEVAKILTLVTRESYKIDEEARRLKLAGQLDPTIYKIMSNGYHDIASRIIQLAKEYKLGEELSVSHKAMKFMKDAIDTYLAEYLRSVGE